MKSPWMYSVAVVVCIGFLTSVPSLAQNCDALLRDGVFEERDERKAKSSLSIMHSIIDKLLVQHKYDVKKVSAALWGSYKAMFVSAGGGGSYKEFEAHWESRINRYIANNYQFDQSDEELINSARTVNEHLVDAFVKCVETGFWFQAIYRPGAENVTLEFNLQGADEVRVRRLTPRPKSVTCQETRFNVKGGGKPVVCDFNDLPANTRFVTFTVEASMKVKGGTERAILVNKPLIRCYQHTVTVPITGRNFVHELCFVIDDNSAFFAKIDGVEDLGSREVTVTRSGDRKLTGTLRVVRSSGGSVQAGYYYLLTLDFSNDWKNYTGTIVGAKGDQYTARGELLYEIK